MDTPSGNSNTAPQTGEDALDLARVREARRAFREFHAQCFWYMPPDLEITLEDVPEIARGLRLHGGRRGFRPRRQTVPLTSRTSLMALCRS